MEKSISVLAVAFAVIILVPASHAQQTGQPARIGILRISQPPPQYLSAFRAGMSARGHEEGRTYRLVPAWTNSRKDRKGIRAMSKKLVAGGIDIIITEGSRVARAAMRATSTIPIVMTSSGDPVGGKLVKSLNRPGGNVTGLHSGTTVLAAKSFQILKELLPGLDHVASLHARKTGGGSFVRLGKQAGKSLGFTMSRLNLEQVDDYQALLRAARSEGIDAIYVRATPFLSNRQQKRLVSAALAVKFPTMYSTSHMARMGGLVSYGVFRPALWRRAAIYVDKILKGAKAGDLPVERPAKFDLSINLKTAQALGIKVPQSLLLRADEVIE